MGLRPYGKPAAAMRKRIRSGAHGYLRYAVRKISGS